VTRTSPALRAVSPSSDSDVVFPRVCICSGLAV
jgi:hypothetical protein